MEVKSKVARFRWRHIKLKKEQTQVLMAHRTATYRSLKIQSKEQISLEIQAKALMNPQGPLYL